MYVTCSDLNKELTVSVRFFFDGKYYLLPRAKEARFRKFVRQLQNGERMENEILSIKTSENA